MGSVLDEEICMCVGVNRDVERCRGREGWGGMRRGIVGTKIETIS